MAVTIAYDRSVKGWTSEFSFNQTNGGISLNNNYYTFFAGEIWRHNDVNSPSNTFYNRYSPTKIVFIMNEAPSSVKNFKTFNYEGNGGTSGVGRVALNDSGQEIAPGTVVTLTNGEEYQNVFTITQINVTNNSNFADTSRWKRVDDGSVFGLPVAQELQWSVEIDTDEEAGRILPSYFVDKEGKKFAHIRGDGDQFENVDFKSVAVQGAGLFANPNVNDGIGTFELSDIPSALSVGDVIYRSEITGESGNTPTLVGRVSAIDFATNEITLGDKAGIEQSSSGALRNFVTPVAGDLCLFIKDEHAEKSGLIGFFATVTMINEAITPAELFSTGSEVFVSTM